MMNEQLNIDAFHDLLNSEGDSGSLLEILKGIREVSDPEDFKKQIDPSTFYGWGGWSL
jgi:hypothetical protein